MITDKQWRHSLLVLILCFTAPYAQNVEKRTSYKIPLIKLSVMQNKEPFEFKRIKITIRGNEKYAIIEEKNDFLIEVKRNGTEKTVYVEAPGARFFLTKFEAQQFKRVIQSLIETLEIFEQDLQNGRWDRCLYLDCFFPKFLQSFYHLNCTILSTYEVLPPETNIPDELFDVSLASPKTDERVKRWRQNRYATVKLRIATREFLYHLKNFIKTEMAVLATNQKIEYASKFKEAYRLFVKMYFNQ